ncbi:hypothetical protein RchiOBHm_Chr2g0088161 [Rosa chinensis]|uniref:Uncharacterized protein n=1 Tax=Rosa chinensis TaxID=74649 RepID=A0A2P6RIV8_ROSCH|nr:hypothetical protein RchiOBHm_Chr2g0088161 [Rosa chinensis]
MPCIFLVFCLIASYRCWLQVRPCWYGLLCVFALEKDTSSFFWYGLFARQREIKRE